MASPQTGIFAHSTNSHAYLEFDRGAEMSKYQLAAPIVGVEHGA
jgi:hypothetical protein